MIAVVRRWLAANRALLSNTSSLMGTTLVTSVLGLAFWGIAPAYFSSNAIGLAAAAIAAMMLIGQVSVLGLGTLLIGEFARQQRRVASLIATALIVAGTVGVILGVLFALCTPLLIPGLQPLGESASSAAVFAAGVGLTAVTLVLDQAFVGLLRGGLQLGRNTILAVTKVGTVMIAGVLFKGAGGLAIYAAWGVGHIISLIGLTVFLVIKRQWPRVWRPRWGLLSGLRRAALGHHALNLVQQVPNTAFPLVVTAILSREMNAYFYYAWMIASFAFFGLSSLTTVLYAVSAANPAALAEKIQLTLRLSAGGGVLGVGIVLLGADLIMAVLGHGDHGYVRYGAPSLRIIELGVFPLIVRTHYVAVSRIHGRLTRASLLIAAGGVLELGAAGLGAHAGGLTGLSEGWLIAVSVEAALMARTVHAAAITAGVPGRREAGERPARRPCPRRRDRRPDARACKKRSLRATLDPRCRRGDC